MPRPNSHYVGDEPAPEKSVTHPFYYRLFHWCFRAYEGREYVTDPPYVLEYDESDSTYYLAAQGYDDSEIRLKDFHRLEMYKVSNGSLPFDTGAMSGQRVLNRILTGET